MKFKCDYELGEPLSPSQQEESLPEMMVALYTRFDYLNDQLKLHSEVGEEALMDGTLGRILIGISDTVIGLANTLKTNVFKSLRTLKRSELREFYESNYTKVHNVEGQPIDRYLKKNVVVPSGMVVPYHKAISDLELLHSNLAGITLTKMAEVAFTNIFKSYSRGDAKALDLATNIANMIQARLKLVDNDMVQFNKDFSGGRTTTVPFIKAYPSMQIFTDVRVKLLDDEQYLRNVSLVTDSVEVMEKALTNTIDLIRKTEATVNRDFVQAVADASLGTAKVVDIYGTAALRQAALEHNHILVINSLYSK